MGSVEARLRKLEKIASDLADQRNHNKLPPMKFIFSGHMSAIEMSARMVLMRWDNYRNLPEHHAAAKAALIASWRKHVISDEMDLRNTFVIQANDLVSRFEREKRS